MSLIVEQVQSTSLVEELYKIVYPDKDTNKFNWLYSQNPAGLADIFIMKDTGINKAIGAYSFIPMNLIKNGKMLLIGQAIDGMVHPDYRNKHIFNKLVAEIFPFVTKKYDFLIGFPNNHSFGSLIRAGWILLGDFITYSLPLHQKALSDSLSSNKILKTLGESLISVPIWINKKYYGAKRMLNKAELTPAGDNQLIFDDILEKIEKINPILMHRSADFIKWRLQTIPKKNYRLYIYRQENIIKGFIAYRIVQHGIEIVDFIIYPTKEHVSTVLSLLIEKAEAESNHSIHFQLSEYAFPCPYLKKYGFIRRDGKNKIIAYPGSFKENTLNWEEMYVSLADTDWL